MSRRRFMQMLSLLLTLPPYFSDDYHVYREPTKDEKDELECVLDMKVCDEYIEPGVIFVSNRKALSIGIAQIISDCGLFIANRHLTKLIRNGLEGVFYDPKTEDYYKVDVIAESKDYDISLCSAIGYGNGREGFRTGIARSLGDERLTAVCVDKEDMEMIYSYLSSSEHLPPEITFELRKVDVKKFRKHLYITDDLCQGRGSSGTPFYNQNKQLAGVLVGIDPYSCISFLLGPEPIREIIEYVTKL